MAIRGTNIFAQLQDSDDEDTPAPKAALSAAAKPAKSVPVSLPPAPKPVPRTAEPATDPVKPQTRGPEKKQKPVQDDRHSKTGRGKEMKKDGQGAHNWGAATQGKAKGPNAGGGWDKPEKQLDAPETAEPDLPDPDESLAKEEAEPNPTPEAKPESKAADLPDPIRLRREEEEKARKEAESYRTYKEYLGAGEEAEEGPKASAPVLMGFMGEAGRGGRGRGRGRRQEQEVRKAAAPDLKDQFAFPKLG